jgi:hypothetical protein
MPDDRLADLIFAMIALPSSCTNASYSKAPPAASAPRPLSVSARRVQPWLRIMPRAPGYPQGWGAAMESLSLPKTADNKANAKALRLIALIKTDDADQAGWGRLARVVESPASGPRNPGNTRSDSRRGAAQDCTVAGRHGSRTLRNHVRNDYGPFIARSSRWRWGSRCCRCRPRLLRGLPLLPGSPASCPRPSRRRSVK